MPSVRRCRRSPWGRGQRPADSNANPGFVRIATQCPLPAAPILTVGTGRFFHLHVGYLLKPLPTPFLSPNAGGNIESTGDQPTTAAALSTLGFAPTVLASDADNSDGRLVTIARADPWAREVRAIGGAIGPDSGLPANPSIAIPSAPAPASIGHTPPRQSAGRPDVMSAEPRGDASVPSVARVTAPLERPTVVAAVSGKAVDARDRNPAADTNGPLDLALPPAIDASPIGSFDLSADPEALPDLLHPQVLADAADPIGRGDASEFPPARFEDVRSHRAGRARTPPQGRAVAKFTRGFVTREPSNLHGGLFELEGPMQHAHSELEVFLIDDDGNLDLRGRYHLNVDTLVGERLEHLARNPDV